MTVVLACALGPIDTFSNPDQLLASLKQLNTIVERMDVKKMFTEDVCLLYDMVTKTRPFAAMFQK